MSGLRGLTPALAWPLLALLAAASSGLAQSAPPPEHVFTIEDLDLDVHQVVDTRDMEEIFQIDCTESFFSGSVPPGGEESGNFEVAEDGRSFTFDESTVRNAGCGEIGYNATFPTGPELLLRVRFDFDRIVTDPPQGQQVPRYLLQELRLLFSDGSRRADQYIAPETGSNRTTFEHVYLMPAGVNKVGVSWYFEDAGVVGDRRLLDPGAHGLTVHVQNITLRIERIPLAMPDVRNVGPELETEDGFVQAMWANVSVPPQGHGPGRSSTVRFQVRQGPELQEVMGPSGRVPATGVSTTLAGDRLTIAVANETVAAQGPGTYTFRFLSTRALPPPIEPGAPTRILPFYYTMLLLPAPAAALAVYSGSTYRHEAEGRYRRAANGILATILVGVVYYLLLVLYSIFVTGKALMTELPLDREATLVYVQLIVLLLFFAVTAVVVGRYLARAMRRDIEQRRAQEERLRRSNEELERFAYVASHDLQEPLRKVAGFTSLLQRRYKGRLDKDADEMIQYAVDGATRMQALIRDILAYSRVGSSELDLKPIETDAMLQLVVSDLGEKIKEEKAQVLWKDLPVVEADAGQLRQVLQNLVENGIKYRHPDRRPRVKVSAEPDGGFWRFSVADNGVGIPADKLAEIFGIFRRLHGNDVPGTGIGLALVKKAVERHGGRVWAESRPGKGSTFYFTVPATDRAVAGRASPADAPGRGTGRSAAGA